MKRFLLFLGDIHYAVGGWKDFCAEFDTYDEAKEYAQKVVGKYQWWHVVDITKKRIVSETL